MDIEEILELTSKLEDKELKSALELKIKDLNKERGSALSDLNGIKEKLNSAEDKNKSLEKESLTLKQLSKALADSGFKDGDLNKIADKLKVQKTHEDDMNAMKTLNKELTEKLNQLQKKDNERTLKETIDPMFDKAMDEYRTKDGEKVTFMKDFVPYDKLYEQIDLQNEVLVQDRLNKVLEETLNKQNDFLTRNNMVAPGQTVHNVKSGDGHFINNGELNVESTVENVIKSGGSREAAVQAIAEIRQKMKK